MNQQGVIAAQKENMVTKCLTWKGSDSLPLSVTFWGSRDDSTVKARILVLHGMAEHHIRYTDFATHLVASGFAVYGYDHRGHGPETRSDQLGDFGCGDGWQSTVADVIEVFEQITVLGPEPVFIFGHSMGSFILQRALFDLGSRPAGVILSGSTLGHLIELYPGLIVAQIENFLRGALTLSKVIHHLTFGAFNRSFKPARTPMDWLSREGEVVDAYIQDPYCGFRCTNRFWVDLMKGLIETFSNSQRCRIDCSVPILIIGGSLDPVGGRAGLERLSQNFKNLGLSHVTTIIYPEGRHEMINEINRLDVFSDISSWVTDVVRNLA